MGVWNEAMATFFSTSQMSMGTDRHQPYTGHSLSALEANRITQYLVTKKLLSKHQADAFKRQYRGTWGDIFHELAPRLGWMLIFTTFQNLTKDAYKTYEEQSKT